VCVQIPGGKQADNSRMGPNKTADQNEIKAAAVHLVKKIVCKETGRKFGQPLYLRGYIR